MNNNQVKKCKTRINAARKLLKQLDGEKAKIQKGKETLHGATHFVNCFIHQDLTDYDGKLCEPKGDLICSRGDMVQACGRILSACVLRKEKRRYKYWMRAMWLIHNHSSQTLCGVLENRSIEKCWLEIRTPKSYLHWIDEMIQNARMSCVHQMMIMWRGHIIKCPNCDYYCVAGWTFCPRCGRRIHLAERWMDDAER